MKGVFMVGMEVSQVARRLVTRQPAKPLKTVSRNICNRGSEQRTIVSGFSGPYTDAKEHFNMLYNLIVNNYRAIVRGFGNQYDHLPGIVVTRTPGTVGRGNIRFFPNYQMPRMTRHVVYDIQPQRKVVSGFNEELMGATKGQVYTTPVKLPTGKDLMSEERTVVKGFSLNTNTAPETKKADLTNNNSRTVVKGFLG